MNNRDRISEEMVTVKNSYMSDAKWSKLLKAIDISDIAYLKYKVLAKTLEDNTPWSILLEDYAGNGIYTGDGIAGPIRTKEIEYIMIPFESKKELSRMKDLIESIGRFEYDIDDRNLTIQIFGYR